MYPMRSQIWSFFQKLGAAASFSSASRPTNKLKRSNSNNMLNPLSLFKNNNNSLSTNNNNNDPDYMFLRYTILTATCVTVAYLLIKLFK